MSAPTSVRVPGASIVLGTVAPTAAAGLVAVVLASALPDAPWRPVSVVTLGLATVALVIVGLRRAVFVSEAGVRVRTLLSSETVPFARIEHIVVLPGTQAFSARVRGRDALGARFARGGRLHRKRADELVELAQRNSVQIEWVDPGTKAPYGYRKIAFDFADRHGLPTSTATPPERTRRDTVVAVVMALVMLALGGLVFWLRILAGDASSSTRSGLDPATEAELRRGAEQAAEIGRIFAEADAEETFATLRQPTSTADCTGLIDVGAHDAPITLIRVRSDVGDLIVDPFYDAPGLRLIPPWTLSELSWDFEQQRTSEMVGVPHGETSAVDSATDVWIEAGGELHWIACR